MKLNLYHKNDCTFLIGSMENNHFHKHYAIQLSIPIGGTLTLFDNKTEIPLTTGVFIRPNIPHRLDSTGNNLHIFFDPHSKMGLHIKSLINGEPFCFDKSSMIDLLEPTLNFINKKIDIQTLASNVERCVEGERFQKFESTTKELILSVWIISGIIDTDGCRLRNALA